MTFDQVVLDTARLAIEANVGESTTVGFETAVPRAADPFVGVSRPAVIAAARWARVAPGAVYLGGTREALDAVLGITAANPAEVPQAQSDQRIRDAAAPLINAVGRAILKLAELPPDFSSTTVSVHPTEQDIRRELGQVPGAVALTLDSGIHSARVVVVVPGVFAARLTIQQSEGQAVREQGAHVARAAHDPGALPTDTRLRRLDDPFTELPIDITVELGRTRISLARVLRAAPGELLELDSTPQQPVTLTTQTSVVAAGHLQEGDHGRLSLRITQIEANMKHPLQS